MRGFGRRPGVTAVALGVLGTLAGLAVLATSGWLVTRAAEQPPVLALLVGIVTVRALGLVRALARYGERLASHDVALRRLADTRVAFFERLSRRIGRPGLPGATDLLTRFTSDVDELQHLHPRVLLPTIVAAAASVGVVIAAALILPAAALPLAAGLILATLIVPAATHALARHTAPGTARAAYGAQLVEALALGPQLAVAGQGPRRLAQLEDASRRLARIDRGQARAAAFGAAATTLAAGITLAAVLQLGTSSDLATVWLGALVLLTLGAFEAPAALPEAALQADRRPRRQAAPQRGHAGPETLTHTGDTPLPRRAALTATNLVHRPGGPDHPIVLDGIDLTVEPGEHVAIVGPSGAGKSTLADLLARLTDPDEGTVALGGVDLKQARDVRDQIRLAGQDAHLLAGTIAANMRIGRADATDHQIEEPSSKPACEPGSSPPGRHRDRGRRRWRRRLGRSAPAHRAGPRARQPRRDPDPGRTDRDARPAPGPRVARRRAGHRPHADRRHPRPHRAGRIRPGGRATRRKRVRATAVDPTGAAPLRRRGSRSTRAGDPSGSLSGSKIVTCMPTAPRQQPPQQRRQLVERQPVRLRASRPRRARSTSASTCIQYGTRRHGPLARPQRAQSRSRGIDTAASCRPRDRRSATTSSSRTYGPSPSMSASSSSTRPVTTARSSPATRRRRPPMRKSRCPSTNARP